ncbi:hypothetical protein B0H19DRAFT_1271213 [Mycena capillaripes]|nr:hypothetical protein B0H19DRAFT_1271213 [Mycena capillaripes]
MKSFAPLVFLVHIGLISTTLVSALPNKRNDIIDLSVKRADTSDPLNKREDLEYTNSYGDESVKRTDIEYSVDYEDEPLKRAVDLT